MNAKKIKIKDTTKNDLFDIEYLFNCKIFDIWNA